MPRLSVCLNPEDPKQNFENENMDFCKECWKLGLDADDLCFSKPGDFKALVELALQVEDMKNGCEHPDYDDTDYTCECCGKNLSNKDN